MIGPKVSILLPCKNAESTLDLALKSMLTQTFTDFELLFLDDGSNDNSLNIAREYNDTRIRVFSDGLSLGLAKRLNQGIYEAKGKYIARMDADDVSFSNRLMKQVDFLDLNPNVDLVGCRALVFNNMDILGLLPFKKDHESLCERLWNNIPLPHPTWLGKRKWFELNAYKVPDVYRAEDQELLLRASLTSTYSCLDEVLLGYRLGGFQSKRSLMTRLSLLKMQLNYFVAHKMWISIFYALSVTALKIIVDLFSSIFGTDRWYSHRMTKDIKNDDIDQLMFCLSKVKSIKK